MPKLALYDTEDWDQYLDDQDDQDDQRPQRGPARTARSNRPHHDNDVLATDFQPTYSGSRHEREWIVTYLSGFYQDQLITDVLHVVKGGKEATVYCCSAHPSTGHELLAAKVYRPKQFRTFKNDADYKWGRPMLDGEGKAVRDRRLLKAVAQGSRKGEAFSHTSWITHEFTTMQTLTAAGASVPEALAHSENAIVMQYLGEAGMPAPPLSEIRLPAEDARHHLQAILRDIEIMLSRDRIHGDLSAYNILFWEGNCTIIDFPQVIDAYGNPNAYRFLQRDVERVCGYFDRYNIHADPIAITRSMWQRTMPDETFQVRGPRSGW